MKLPNTKKNLANKTVVLLALVVNNCFAKGSFRRRISFFFVKISNKADEIFVDVAPVFLKL